MRSQISDLESLITQTLQYSTTLKNAVERKEIEKSDQLKEISIHIIDILDSFEIIEDSLNEKGIVKDSQEYKLIIRYKTIQRKLLNLLQRYGITKIEFPDNKLIIGFSEVVETEPDIYRKNDEIISIVRNGYTRGTELIRVAQLIVVKN